MLRPIVAFALSLAPAAALAAADPALEQQKTEVRELKRYAKDVEKLVRKWEKAAEKRRVDDLVALDAELAAIERAELRRLREAGIRPLVSEFERQPDKVVADRPRMQALFDDLVEARALRLEIAEGTARPKDLERRNELLGHLRDNIAERHARAERRYEEAKAGV